MKRAIVTYAAGEHEKLLEISRPGFQKFADLYGYDLIVGEKMTDRPPAWNKIPLMLNALDKYDSVTWFDCDLVIVDFSRDIELPTGFTHGLVRHFTLGSEVPNSGMWVVTQKELLEKCWELEVFMNHGWWEQAALLTVMGYIVPPEGSIFNKTKCRCVRVTQWRRDTWFFRVEWNSHPEYRAEPPRIVHCSYAEMDLRIATMLALVQNPAFDYPTWPKKKDGDVSTSK